MMGEKIIFALPEPTTGISKLIEQLDSTQEIDIVMGARTISKIAHSKRFPNDFGFSALDKLSSRLNQSSAMDYAITLAMYWLARNNQEQAVEWMKNESRAQIILMCLEQPNFDKEATPWLVYFVGEVKEIRVVELLIAKLIAKLDDEDKDVRRAACYALGQIKDVRAVEPLIAKLDDEDKDVRSAAYDALGKIKDVRAVEPLIAKLDHEDKDVRRAACYALREIKDVRAVEPLIAKLDDEDKDVRQQALDVLAKITQDEIDQKLLSRDIDAVDPWLDPKEPIAHARIAKAAETLNLPPEEIQRRYEVLAQQFGLILEWKQ
jgi:hypothetical protein